MKSRSLKQRREAIEVIAANAHRMMTDAKQLLDCQEEACGMSLARAAFPITVQVVHQRSLPSPNRNLLLPTTSTLLKGMKSGKALSVEQYEALQRANAICTLGWDGAADARHVVDVSLQMLELTEPQNRKQRRQEASQAATVATKRFSFYRWAAGVLGVAGTATT